MSKTNRQKPVLFENIKQIIHNCAAVYADRTAYVIKRPDGYLNKSFKELLNDVNAFGSGLFELGLGGGRVAVMGRNRYEWAVTLLATLMGGMVSVPLDKELMRGELTSSLKRSGANALVYDGKYHNIIQEIKPDFGDVRFICMDGGLGDLSFAEVSQLGLDSAEFKNYTDFKPDADVMSVLLFTSGTTDRSKAVMLCQRGIARNIYDMRLVEDINCDDVNMAFLPFHHIFALTGLLMMLACGVKTVFTDGLRYVRKNLKEYGVTVFVGVPVIIDKLYAGVENEIKKRGAQKRFALALKVTAFLKVIGADVRRRVFKAVTDGLGGSLRLIISGGAPLCAETARSFNALGITLVQGYGLTETSPVIAAEGPGIMRRGSVGKPMSGTQVRIAHADGSGMGEIQVRGLNVMLGYYGDEAATRAAFEDGWFRTGDLGRMDSDGYLYITGRTKDVIVMRNGKKVFPEELETLINRVEGVKESLVYGVGDGSLGCERILCKVVYDPAAFDDGTAYEALWSKIKEINKTLPIYKYIKGMILSEEPLIRTTTNKIKRNEEIKKILK